MYLQLCFDAHSEILLFILVRRFVFMDDKRKRIQIGGFSMRLAKRALSMLLSVILVLSVFTIIPATTASAAFAQDTITVFFTDALNWNGGGCNSIYVHYWKQEQGNVTDQTTWPGSAMTEIYTNGINGGQRVYAADIPSDVSGVIFNNNNGSQTVDITSAIADNAWWYTDGTYYDGKANVGSADSPAYTAAAAATCTAAGNTAYYLMDNVSGSNVYWNGEYGTDKLVTNNVDDFTIASTGHQNPLTHHDAVAETNDTPGNIEYWTCDDCGAYFSDDQGTTEITQAQTVIPAHNGTKTVNNAAEFNAAMADTTVTNIVLGADITDIPAQQYNSGNISNSAQLVINRDVTIDLAGHTISGLNNGTRSAASPTGTTASKTPRGLLFINNGADVTINGPGTITNTTTTASATVISCMSGSLTTNGITITTGNTTYATVGIAMFSGVSNVVTNNTTITAGCPFYGNVGASYKADSSLTINSGTYTAKNNSYHLFYLAGTSASYAGNSFGTFTINGGTFVNTGSTKAISNSGKMADRNIAAGGKFYGVSYVDLVYLAKEGKFVKVTTNTDSSLPAGYCYEIVDSDPQLAATITNVNQVTCAPYDTTATFCVEKDFNVGTFLPWKPSGLSTSMTRTLTVRDDIVLSTASNTNNMFGGGADYFDNLIIDIAEGATVTGSIKTRLCSFALSGEGTFNVTLEPYSEDYEVTYDTNTNTYYSDYPDSACWVVYEYTDGSYRKIKAEDSQAFSGTYLDEGCTIKLLQDVTFSSTINLKQSGGLYPNFSIDLNGHTLKYSGSTGTPVTVVDDQTISIINSSETTGKFISSSSDYVIQLGSSSTSGSNVANNSCGKMVIGENVEVQGDVTVLGASQLDVYGTIKTFSTFALNANATYGYNDSQKITLHSGSKVISTASGAIYKPQAGQLIVEDGATVSGTDYGIWMRQGELIVEGGTITASNGPAILIESQTGYPRGVDGSVTGGTFNSPAGTAPIQSNAFGTGYTALSGFVAPAAGSTIILSEDISDDCIGGGYVLDDYGTTGKKTLEFDPAASITDGDDTSYYSTFAKAQTAAAGTKTITLIKDVADPITLSDGETLIVNKNGKSITVQAAEGCDLTTTEANGVFTYTAANHVHSYSLARWTWDGYTKATAIFSCACGDEQTVTATEGNGITSQDTTPATCTAPGTRTYTASVLFNGTTYENSTSDTIPATGHDMTHHAAVAKTCTTAGSSEYWSCDRCNKFFSDEGGENEITADSWIIPASHTLQRHPAQDATCTLPGNIDYWECTVCHKLFSDGNGANEITQAQTVIPAAGHNMTHHAAVAKTCTTAGSSEYWSCDRCNKFFSDEDGENEIAADSWIIPASHNLEHHDAVAATPSTDGSIEYWQCSVCEKYFSDANAETEITQSDTVVNATGVVLIDGQPYGDLSSAVAAADPNDELVVADTIDLDASVEIDKNLTLDLGDTTMFYSSANNGPALVVKTGTTVTLKNGTIKVQASRNANIACAVEVESGATLIIEDTASFDSANDIYLNAGGTIQAPGSMTLDIVVPDGYILVTSTSGGVTTYTAELAVASVNGTPYTTLAAAVEAANGEAAIKVLASGQSYQLSVGESFKLALDTAYTPTFTSANPEYYVTYTTEANWYDVYLAQYAVKAVVPNYGTYYFTEAQMNDGHWLYNVYSGTTITLLTDMTYTKNVAYGATSTKSYTLDLGGHTLTFASPAAGTHSIYSRSNNTITVRNGRILFTTDDGFWMKGGTLNVENGAILEATNGYSPIIMTHDGVVNVKPGAQVKSVNSWAIATNGSSGNGGYTINITGGEVTATNAPAIYHANTGTLNISDGTISGTAAVYVKSGTTNITGGTFNATGAAGEYTYNGNGTTTTGDAIIIDSCGYPGGTPSLTITGDPTFISENGVQVGDYINGENEKPEIVSETKALTLPEGQMWVPGETAGTYVIGDVFATVDGEPYATFEDAVEAANGEKTIVLMADYDGTYTMTEGQTLIVDKNGFTFNTPTIDGENVVSSTHEGAVYTYTTSEATWKVEKGDTVIYTNNIQSYLTSPANGMVVTLLKDTSIGRTCVGGALTRNFTVTLDLGGNKLTSSVSDSDWSAIYFHDRAQNCELIIKNGEIEVKNGAANVFHVRGSQTLTLEDDLTVDAASDVVLIEGAGATLNTAAELTTTSNYGIVGIGSDVGGTEVNVTGGKVEAADVAIYQPQAGELNISGGEITAECAVYAKSGDVTVSGGTLHSTSEDTEYSPSGSGVNVIGDAIVIDSCGYPGGTPSLTITGDPTFISDNGVQVGDYVNGDNEKATVTAQSSTLTLPEGLMWVETETAGTYKVADAAAQVFDGETKVGDYETFDAAVEAAEGQYTIKLLADVEDEYTMSVGETLIVEKGNFTLTVNAPDNCILNEETVEGVTTYTVLSAVAMVNETAYPSFEDAAAARETNDDVITLLTDIEDAYTMTAGETLKVEKGDYDLTVNPPVGDGIILDVEEADGITTYKAVSVSGIVYSATLSLKDCIDINFYVKNIPDYTDRSDYSMTYTFHDTDTTCDIPADNGSSIVVASCAAKEMTDTVDIVVKYKDNVIKTIEDYSVSQYCYNKLASDQSSDEIKALCNSALTYGLYSQEYFEYELDNQPVPENPDVSGVDVPADYAPVSTGQCDSVKKIAATLMLESRTQLNFYVTPADGKTADDLTITITKDGQPVDYDVTMEGSVYHANISGIAARDLDEAYTITVSDGSSERQITYSPLTYSYSKQSNSDENLANCAKALYNYYLKAEAYFASGKTN